jgi:hypothetical protein
MMHETLVANRLSEQSVKDEGTIGLAGIYPIWSLGIGNLGVSRTLERTLSAARTQADSGHKKCHE